jgi:hypothetical protein
VFVHVYIKPPSHTHTHTNTQNQGKDTRCSESEAAATTSLLQGSASENEASSRPHGAGLNGAENSLYVSYGPPMGGDDSLLLSPRAAGGDAYSPHSISDSLLSPAHAPLSAVRLDRFFGDGTEDGTHTSADQDRRVPAELKRWNSDDPRLHMPAERRRVMADAAVGTPLIHDPSAQQYNAIERSSSGEHSQDEHVIHAYGNADASSAHASSTHRAHPGAHTTAEVLAEAANEILMAGTHMPSSRSRSEYNIQARSDGLGRSSSHAGLPHSISDPDMHQTSELLDEQTHDILRAESGGGRKGVVDPRLSKLKVADCQQLVADRDKLGSAVGEQWQDVQKRVRQASPYGGMPHWRLISVIVKSNDDVRQEQFATQLITLFAPVGV